jgi:hypothetical protein
MAVHTAGSNTFEVGGLIKLLIYLTDREIVRYPSLTFRKYQPSMADKITNSFYVPLVQILYPALQQACVQQ